MKLLFVSEVLPYPPMDGRRIPVLGLMEQLAQRHDISLLCFYDEEDSEYLEDSVTKLGRLCNVEGVFPTNSVNKRKGLRNLFSRYPLSITRYSSREFKDRLFAIAETGRFDVAHFFGVNMARFWRVADHLPSVLAPNDSTSLLLQRMFRDPSLSLPRRLYSYVQGRKMGRYETGLFPHFHHTYVVSPIDLQAMLKANPAIRSSVISNGIDPEYFAPIQTNGGGGVPKLICTGAMGSLKNVEGIVYFAREIYPLIKEQVPAVQLYVVGSNPDSKLLALASEDASVTVTGFVEDIRPYLASADVYICPLILGVGIKNRILEAMAMGRAIVTTSVGSEGLLVTPGEDLIVADRPEGFANAVVKLIEDGGERVRLGTNARDTVLRNYTWAQKAREVESVYDRVTRSGIQAANFSN